MSEQQDLRILDERPGLRCPYCHGDVFEDEAQEACEGCRASHHQECWDAHGGCSSCGVARQLAALSPVVRSAPAGPQIERVRRRRQATRLGGVGLLRYEHGEDETVLEWGSNLGEARGRLKIAYLVAALGLLFSGLLLLKYAGVSFGPPIPTLLVGLAAGPALFLFHLFELLKSGRLVIDRDGLRRDRLSFKGEYLTRETIPWSDVAELGWRGSKLNRSYTVYAETASGRRTLADFRFEQHAREFIGHFQRSRARLAAEVDASLIRVQRRDDTKGVSRERP